jgi:hypothetical protein
MDITLVYFTAIWYIYGNLVYFSQECFVPRIIWQPCFDPEGEFVRIHTTVRMTTASEGVLKD